MRLYRDTSSEIESMQVELWRRLGSEGRLDLALQMSDDVRELSRCGIRSRHPEYDERQVENALRLILLGEELFRAAWPDEALLAP